MLSIDTNYHYVSDKQRGLEDRAILNCIPDDFNSILVIYCRYTKHTDFYTILYFYSILYLTYIL